jgi:hypothetical protein
MAYEAKLPEGVSLPEGHRIDVSDARYKQLEQLATSQKWTQEAFSSVLGLEAGRVNAAHAGARAAAPAPTPAPAPAKVPENWDGLSMRAQFARSLATPSKRG